jgi:hypothetical protein
MREVKRARETHDKNRSNISKQVESIITSLKVTIPPAFRIVFHNHLYIAIATAVFTTFWIIFNLFDQLLFFSPVATFYLPDDAVTGFIITNITSVLMGILIAMNIYVIRNSKIKLDRSLFSGSILGVAFSACASCSSIGFLIISTLGGFGVFATDFLTTFQTPLRIVSIAILLWALYSVHNRVKRPCIFNNTYSKNDRQQKTTASSTTTIHTEKDVI